MTPNPNHNTIKQHTKHLTLVALLCLTCAATAQVDLPLNTATNSDTAKAIVEHYLRSLNYDALPADSMLYIESSIFDFNDRSDTLVMKRWFLPPHNHRVELWEHGAIKLGYLTNGTNNARRYDTIKHRWQRIDLADYYDKGYAYDFHSPLYTWRTNGTELQYLGEWEIHGVKVDKVHAETPGMFIRDYLFEKENGLLFFVIEHSEVFGGETDPYHRNVDWRAYTDYIHIGKSLLPYTESYKQNGRVTVINHRYAFLKKDRKKFE